MGIALECRTAPPKYGIVEAHYTEQRLQYNHMEHAPRTSEYLLTQGLEESYPIDPRSGGMRASVLVVRVCTSSVLSFAGAV